MTLDLNIKNPLEEWAKSVQHRLNAGYEESRSVLNHQGAVGAIREEIIRSVLKSFLPQTVQIGTGQVVDSTGKLSNQVDIVIARGNAPAFRFIGNVSAFLHETVFATIEVKSMLYRDKLLESLDNSRTVKELTYLLGVRSKGKKIFDEAFAWVDSVGGLDKLDTGLYNPQPENVLDCPEEIWKVIPFIHYWLHWQNGDFMNAEKVEKMRPFIAKADFDFFIALLALTLKEKDVAIILSKKFSTASKIRNEFFTSLFEYLHSDDLPPQTFIFAYGGYENLDNLINEVRVWYDQHRESVEWWQLPRVILNHKMVMYRTFNDYHCHEFEYPVLFLINAIIEVLVEDLHYPVSYSLVTGLTPYFDLGNVLGNKHPRYSPSYRVWSIPLDNSSSGEITVYNKK